MQSKSSLLRFSGLLSAPLFAMAAISSAQAADAVAAVDKAFVGKVSQGGRFEVEASTLAKDKASSQDVKDFAAKDVEDHDKVNDELKSIAAAQGLPLAPDLNKKFSAQLKKLGALSGATFDKAYISAMAKIHKKDEGIFAKEAQAGANADWKAFAAKTDEIVKGHIAALGDVQAKLK